MAQLWFKFWAKEYLADTKVRCLSYEQRGILQTLWAFAWEEGSIPSDQAMLGNMLGMSAKAMCSHYEWILRFFAPALGDPSRLVSPRLELDRSEAEAKGMKARESAMRRWDNRNADAMRTHMPTDSEGLCVQDASQKSEVRITTPKAPKGASEGVCPREDLLQQVRSFWPELQPGTRDKSVPRTEPKKLRERWIKACKSTPPEIVFLQLWFYVEDCKAKRQFLAAPQNALSRGLHDEFLTAATEEHLRQEVGHAV